MIRNKVLLTTNHFAEFKGSEITILEHAQYFASRGYYVVVFTNLYSDLTKLELSNVTNNNFFLTDDCDYPFNLDDFKYIWIQHQLIPNSIIDALVSYSNIEDIIFIFAHLSSFIHIEFPWLYDLEERLADLSLVISEEAKEVLDLYKLNTNIQLYRNPTNITWYLKSENTIWDSNNNGLAKKILIVSNHIPEEVKNAVRILKNEYNYNIDIIGDGYTKGIRVNPSIIDNYDIIFTIGKTVQYSILRNKIVYCYDHFGGPGFLNHNNFELARYHNFSGRGFSKKNVDEIVDDFLNLTIRRNLFFDDSIKKEFIIEYKLDSLLNTIKFRKKENISKTLAFKLKNLLEMYRGAYRTYEYYKSLVNKQTT